MTMDRHLDDELLSTVLDDEASDDDVAHAQSCPQCSSRLLRLRSVALAVAAPPEPATETVRGAAIARAVHEQQAALASVAQERAASAEARDGNELGVIRALGSRRAHPQGGGHRVRPMGEHPEPGLTGTWERRPPRWAVAAAIVVVLGLAVPLIGSRLGTGRPQTAATGLADSRSGSEPERSAAAGATDHGAKPPVDGGDLGELSGASLDQLAARLGGTDPQGASPTADPGAGPGVGPVASDPAPAAGQVPPTEGPCEVVARSRDSHLGLLRYRARGTVEREAVTVLAFESLGSTGDRPGQLVVMVLAADTCAQVPTAPAP